MLFAAGIGVYQYLQTTVKSPLEGLLQRITRFVTLGNVVVPGEGQVTIYINHTAVPQCLEVVDVNPVVLAVPLDRLGYQLEHLGVGLVHQSVNGLVQDFDAGHSD